MYPKARCSRATTATASRIGVLIIHRVLHERVLASVQVRYPADANWNYTRLLNTFGPIKMHLDLFCTANLVDLFIGAHKLVYLLAHLPAQIECVTLDRISKKESRLDTYALEYLTAMWRVVRTKLRALRSFVATSRSALRTLYINVQLRCLSVTTRLTSRPGLGR